MPYTSQGTITVEFDTGNNKKYLFAPEHDYSIKHGENTYAVFVEATDEPTKALTMRLNETTQAVEIELDPLPSSTAGNFHDRLLFHVRLDSAAMTHSKVQVKVEDDKLIDVIPAKSRRLQRSAG